MTLLLSNSEEHDIKRRISITRGINKSSGDVGGFKGIPFHKDSAGVGFIFSILVKRDKSRRGSLNIKEMRVLWISEGDFG